jgi:hypothetical protein
VEEAEQKRRYEHTGAFTVRAQPVYDQSAGNKFLDDWCQYHHE